MNSNSGRVLRSNARRRTPLSNSLRTDHNRSTTELYSPRNAPTSHTTRYDAATSATGAHDALQRAPAATGDAAPNAPASNGLQRPRVRRESPPSIAATITSTIGSRSLCAHTHLTRPRARTRVHRILARTHAARHGRTHARTHAHTLRPAARHERAGFILTSFLSFFFVLLKSCTAVENTEMNHMEHQSHSTSSMSFLRTCAYYLPRAIMRYMPTRTM
ncbi:hypothetical protein PVAP13_9KG183585 [Panicum virgatum]|uniref:Uncharacterized protein n=1 Tax=Panicum virgatum TaxID=38727 RepID=A0A8T0NMM0_PANVG|nr:hypothetical protein PVAP13_9KG183585 [Panicum virgatum]